jgi:long-chain acyl-CoA synthetase
LEESHISEIYTVRELVDAVLESAVLTKAGEPAVHGTAWQTVLEEAPTDPQVLRLTRTQRFLEGFWYLITRFVLLFAYDRFQLRVSGMVKLPKRGAYLICSNHQSFIDPIVMVSTLPWSAFREIFFVGTSEIFGQGFMRQLARWLRIKVIDPDANLIPAMQAAAFGLRHGRVLILYPEGERSIDGTPKGFKKGAAILSIHLQAPIVPVAIEGFYEAWPRGKEFIQKFAPLKIMFGDPIFPPERSTASDTVYETLTAELKTRVVKMWTELSRAHTVES